MTPQTASGSAGAGVSAVNAEVERLDTVAVRAFFVDILNDFDSLDMAQIDIAHGQEIEQTAGDENVSGNVWHKPTHGIEFKQWVSESVSAMKFESSNDGAIVVDLFDSVSLEGETAGVDASHDEFIWNAHGRLVVDVLYNESGKIDHMHMHMSVDSNADKSAIFRDIASVLV